MQSSVNVNGLRGSIVTVYRFRCRKPLTNRSIHCCKTGAVYDKIIDALEMCKGYKKEEAHGKKSQQCI